MIHRVIITTRIPKILRIYQKVPRVVPPHNKFFNNYISELKIQIWRKKSNIFTYLTKFSFCSKLILTPVLEIIRLVEILRRFS